MIANIVYHDLLIVVVITTFDFVFLLTELGSAALLQKLNLIFVLALGGLVLWARRFFYPRHQSFIRGGRLLPNVD